MKTTLLLFAIVITFAQPVVPLTFAAEATKLSARQANGDLELSWPAVAQQPDGSVARPYFELQRTFDFHRWEPVGERQRALTATLGQSLSATQPLDEPHDAAHLDRLIELLGPDLLCFSTDYPHWDNDMPEDSLRSLAPADRQRIFYDNARAALRWS